MVITQFSWVSNLRYAYLRDAKLGLCVGGYDIKGWENLGGIQTPRIITVVHHGKWQCGGQCGTEARCDCFHI